LKCSTFRENLQELNLWIGSAGTRSLVHWDADDILHCVISGQKDWILYDYKYKQILDSVHSSEDSKSGYSLMDVDKIDMEKYSDLYKVPWNHARLNAGDCLILPNKYMHQVRSHSRSISVTFLMQPEILNTTFSDSDCKKYRDSQDLQVNLKDVDVWWDRKTGQKTIDIGYWNMRMYKLTLINLINYMGSPVLNIRQLTSLFASLFRRDEVKMIRKLVKTFDTNNDKLIEVEEIINSKRDEWKSFARSLDDGGLVRESTDFELSTSGWSNKSQAPSQEFKNREEIKLIKNIKKIADEFGEVTFKKFIENFEGPSKLSFFSILDVNMDGSVSDSELNINKVDVKLRQLSRCKLHLKKKTKSFKEAKRKSYLDKIVELCVKKIRNDNKDKELDFEDFKSISAQVINDTQAEVDYHLLFLLLKPRNGYLTPHTFDVYLKDEFLHKSMLFMRKLESCQEYFSLIFQFIIEESDIIAKI